MIKTHEIGIRVEQCIDSEDWVWTLLDPWGGDICDGYSGSEAEAMADARKRRLEEVEYLNTPSETQS